MTRIGIGVDRRWPVMVLATIGALAGGSAVGLSPTISLLVVGGVAAALLCLLIPLRLLPGLLVAITIAMPTLVFDGIGGSGQARAVIAVLALALLRLLMTRAGLRVPRLLALGIGAALALTLMTAMVASGKPPSQVGGTGDLIRDLSYPAAAVVGFIGGSSARRGAGLLAVARPIGWLSLVAALLCFWYWSWHALGVPALNGGLFARILGSSGFADSRSIFPFVEDSPNVGAVIFVLLAAFSAPPLLLAVEARNRILGVAVAAASLAAVLCTQSRTGLFAAAAACLVYLLLASRRGARRRTIALIAVAVVGAGATAVATFPTERASSDTLQARLHIWSQAGRAFLADPIFGHGYEYSLKGNFVESGTVQIVSHVQSTHSDLMSALVDGGVIGGAMFVAVLCVMVLVARRSLADPAGREAGIAYSCLLAAAVVGGLDNTVTQSAAAVTLIWTAFGLVVATLGSADEESVSSAVPDFVGQAPARPDARAGMTA